MAAVMTKADFARHIGRDRSWVTRMAQAGRLVLEGSGPHARVRVAESLAAIRQTAGTRDDVAERHAAARQNSAEGANAAPDAAEAAPSPDRGALAPADGRSEALDELDTARRDKILAESRRVQAAADREEMARDKEAGNLIAREDVDAAMKFIGATVRGLVDVMPDQVAPLVAPVSDLDQVHALLSDAGRQLLERLGEAVEQQRAALAKAES